MLRFRSDKHETNPRIKNVTIRGFVTCHSRSAGGGSPLSMFNAMLTMPAQKGRTRSIGNMRRRKHKPCAIDKPSDRLAVIRLAADQPDQVSTPTWITLGRSFGSWATAFATVARKCFAFFHVAAIELLRHLTARPINGTGRPEERQFTTSVNCATAVRLVQPCRIRQIMMT